MPTLRTHEVATLLDKSSETVLRYRDDGILKATKNGREWLFDRDSVLEFARSRGIHPAEREVPQGSNFTGFRQAQTYLQNHLADGVELRITKSANART